MAASCQKVVYVDSTHVDYYFDEDVIDAPGDMPLGFTVNGMTWFRWGMALTYEGLPLPSNVIRFTYPGTVHVGDTWICPDTGNQELWFSGEDGCSDSSGTVIAGTKQPHPGMEGGMQHLDGGIGG